VAVVLTNFVRSLGLNASFEPKEARQRIEGKEVRPDIRTFGLDALVDVAIVNPCAPSNLAVASRKAGAAASS